MSNAGRVVRLSVFSLENCQRKLLRREWDDEKERERRDAMSGVKLSGKGGGKRSNETLHLVVRTHDVRHELSRGGGKGRYTSLKVPHFPGFMPLHEMENIFVNPGNYNINFVSSI